MANSHGPRSFDYVNQAVSGQYIDKQMTNRKLNIVYLFADYICLFLILFF